MSLCALVGVVVVVVVGYVIVCNSLRFMVTFEKQLSSKYKALKWFSMHRFYINILLIILLLTYTADNAMQPRISCVLKYFQSILLCETLRLPVEFGSLLFKDKNTHFGHSFTNGNVFHFYCTRLTTQKITLQKVAPSKNIVSSE